VHAFPRLPLLIALGFVLPCAGTAEEWSSRFLGESLRVEWTPPPVGADILRQTLAAETARLETLLGRDAPGGALARVNAQAGGDAADVPEELVVLLLRCREYWRRSDGLVDPSFGPVTRLWNFEDRGFPAVPRLAGLREALDRVDFGRVQLLGGPPRVRLPRDFSLDLNRLAPGTLADRLLRLFADAGVPAARVQAGPLVRAAELPPGAETSLRLSPPGRPYRAVATLALRQRALATASVEHRFIVVRGQRYHDVLNPRTGWPAAGCASVTVAAASAEYAQAIAGALLALSPEIGRSLLQKFPEAEAVWIGLDGRVLATPGLQAELAPEYQPVRP
jgi:thiamine biosynthesis lipoprotein